MAGVGLLAHWCKKVKESAGFVSDCKALAGVMLFTQGAVHRHPGSHKTRLAGFVGTKRSVVTPAGRPRRGERSE